VATVVVTATALEDLASLIRTHSLPAETRERVKRSIEPLRTFPLLDARLAGPWSAFRFVPGPRRWNGHRVHLRLAGRLPSSDPYAARFQFSRDPFDRMLVAQAFRLDATIVSRDPFLDPYG
jgi:hypothetical protein